MGNYPDDRLIYFHRNYRSMTTDWCEGLDENFSFFKECLDSLTDIYIASQCDFLLGGASNMLLGALCMNLNLNFKLPEALKTADGN